MRNKYNRVTTDDLPMDSSFAPIVERATDKIKTRKKINAIGKSTEEKMKQRMQPQYTFYEKTNEQLKARL